MYYNGSSRFLALYCFIGEFNALYWIHRDDESYCRYGENILPQCSVKLPYLPFDISPEKLKTYLTFL